MTRRRALCVGGPPALHDSLAAAYAAQEIDLAVVAEPLVGAALEARRSVDEDSDILVWAAFVPSDARFGSVTVPALEAYLERTVFSAVQTAQACLRGMERRRWGRILALTNMAGHLGDEDILASIASGAIEGFVRSVAREGPRKGVTANALVIGQIEGWDAACSRISRPFYEMYYPFREPFTVADLATTIVELTTSKAARINGQVIGFDGGTIL